jgi:hypothetical protein
MHYLRLYIALPIDDQMNVPGRKSSRVRTLISSLIIIFVPKPSFFCPYFIQPKSKLCTLQTPILLVVLRVQNARHIPLLNPLQRQCRDQRSTNTGSILSGQNLNGIFLL